MNGPWLTAARVLCRTSMAQLERCHSDKWSALVLHESIALNRHEIGQTTTPQIQPIPAVTAIASAPQLATRSAPVNSRAPPARAANAPRPVRQISEADATKSDRLASGAATVTNSGIGAPAANAAADAGTGEAHSCAIIQGSGC